MSSYQAAVLEDGTVTEEEYAAAVEAQRECVVEAGALPGPIEELPGEQLGFHVDVPVTEDGLGDEDLSQKVFDCASEYSSQVGARWSRQHAPTAEDYARLLPPLVDCMRDVPLDGLSENPTREEALLVLSEAMSEGGAKAEGAVACADANRDVFRS